MNYKRIIEAFKKHKNFLVVAHVNPDPDAICSQLAVAILLKAMGKKFTVIHEEKLEQRSPSPIVPALFVELGAFVSFAFLEQGLNASSALYQAEECVELADELLITTAIQKTVGRQPVLRLPIVACCAGKVWKNRLQQGTPSC